MNRFFRGLLALVLIVSVGAALSGRLDELIPATGAAAPSPMTPSARVVAAVEQDASAAIREVIERSNDQQVQAIAAGDPSLMAETLTSDHYQELIHVNQDLLDNGVTSIKLIKLEWGAVAVDGSTATATTYETWTTTFSDGTTDQTRDRNDYTLVLDNGAWKIKTDAHPNAGQQAGGGSGPATNTPPPLPRLADDRNVSHNWSGYAATSGTYTAVTGTWSVPQFNADASFGIDAAWVGIGGVRSHDLIQAGTQQTVSGSGRTHYEAWIETLPSSSRQVPVRVHPGDSVTVSIAEQAPNEWLIAFNNNTTGQTYQETAHYASSHSSAEWVEEAPSAGRGGVLPLDNFGVVQFSNGSTVKDGNTLSIAGASARPITMVGAGEQPLAVPSSLSDDGASFAVARSDNTVTAAPRQRRGYRLPLPLGEP